MLNPKQKKRLAKLSDGDAISTARRRSLSKAAEAEAEAAACATRAETALVASRMPVRTYQSLKLHTVCGSISFVYTFLLEQASERMYMYTLELRSSFPAPHAHSPTSPRLFLEKVILIIYFLTLFVLFLIWFFLNKDPPAARFSFADVFPRTIGPNSSRTRLEALGGRCDVSMGVSMGLDTAAAEAYEDVYPDSMSIFEGSPTDW